jgi:hypothetical protein
MRKNRSGNNRFFWEQKQYRSIEEIRGILIKF